MIKACASCKHWRMLSMAEMRALRLRFGPSRDTYGGRCQRAHDTPTKAEDTCPRWEMDERIRKGMRAERA